MLRNSLFWLVLALTLSATTSARLSAQADTSYGTEDTYVTNDGYGLGRIVPGSLTDVTARARAAMIKQKIVEESARPLGQGWRELRGKKGDLDVSIRLRRQSASTTRVEINARQGLTGWDKGFEQQLLDAVGKT